MSSKQQTAMKLYTEEEVVRAIELSDGRSTDEVLAGLTPIQLPSDEEVGNEASARHYGTNFKHVFASGAKWMRDKIQGGQQ
jgi:hypothetical protein